MFECNVVGGTTSLDVGVVFQHFAWGRVVVDQVGKEFGEEWQYYRYGRVDYRFL